MEQELDVTLAQLVIRDRFRRRKVRFGRRTGPLVLQLESASEALRQWPKKYYEEYRGFLPVNEPTEAPQNEVSGKPVADELLDIAQGCGFGGRPAYRLPIVFPRFAAAYAVLIAWEPDARHGNREQHDAELERRFKQAIGEARRDVLPELRKWFGELSRDPYLGKPLGGLAGLILRLVGAFRFPHFRTVRWYRKKGFGAQSLPTTRVLIQELRAWRQKRSAEQELLLVEALLADIDAHYGFFRRLNRARRPAILLSDVDLVPARRRIRDTLLTAYDGKSRDLRVHPIVIATSAPNAAPPEKGANGPVAPAELMEEIPKLFVRRDRSAEARKRGDDVPLPSRLLQVFVEPSSRRPKRRRVRPGPVTSAVISLVVVVGLIVGVVCPIYRHSKSCGKRLEQVGQDCVGVSDGTEVFMPDVAGMKEVYAGIAAENKRIATKKHATVALMIPLESEIPSVRTQILSEVQGAYLAQLAANDSDAAKPPIRLVLANPGQDYARWKEAASKLVRQEPELRVVADFNLSLDNTRNAIVDLTKTRRIPVVAGLVTSGDFANPESQDRDHDPFPGLARVVSAAKEQADALLTFDPNLAGAETALVADTRPKDNYDNSLREAFTEARRGKKNGAGVQDMTFESPGLEEEGITPNKFEDFALNLCQSKARYVYFAGRAFHLKIFIEKLAGTYCAGKRSYTVITGSDATSIDSRLDAAEHRLLRGDPGAGRPSVSVEYAAPAHPDEWTSELAKWQRSTRNGSRPGNDSPPRYLAEPQEAMAELKRSIAAARIGPVQLDDGRAIIAHDVILTAAKELARAVAVNNTEVPTTKQVKDSLAELSAAYRIHGASGWICLTNSGNPYDKALSVVRLDPESAKLRFEGVAWPEGRPPKDNCVVPQTTP